MKERINSGQTVAQGLVNTKMKERSVSRPTMCESTVKTKTNSEARLNQGQNRVMTKNNRARLNQDQD